MKLIIYQTNILNYLQFCLFQMLNPMSKCPLAEKLLNNVLKSQFVQDYLFKYNDFLQNISKITGERINNFRRIRDMFDTILITKHNQLKLPQWITPEVYRKLKELYKIAFYIDFTSTIEPDIKYLRTGLLLNEILENLNIVKNPYKPFISIYVTVSDFILNCFLII